MVAKTKIPFSTEIQTLVTQFLDIHYAYGIITDSYCKMFHIFSKKSGVES
jgi:hypothetical protein